MGNRKISMQKTVVLNVVGLTTKLIGSNTPFLKRWSNSGKTTKIKSMLPAVTCSVQSSYLTGKWPNEHGIIGNGWYFKDLCEVKFWHQSNKLVEGHKIWDIAKKSDPNFTCANMFWWYNMYSDVDYSVTPRPIYTADGLKIPDCYTNPSNLRDELQSKLGPFPLFNFWGPKTSITSSKWIAEASKIVEQKFNPTLTLIYLPHLDYCLQKNGPDSLETRESLREIDRVCEDLINFYLKKGANVIILSEYGIEKVNRAIHINRILREKGYLKVRNENGGEILDAGASRAFAVSDHQIAHVYVNDRSLLNKIYDTLLQIDGVDYILDKQAQEQNHIDHQRSGDFIAVASKGCWFSYYYWLDDKYAPDFARAVDIHKKPGYDPAELFINPKIKWPQFKIFMTLMRKKMGFRYLMDFIPLDASLVKGSHGRIFEDLGNYPILISQRKDLLLKPFIAAPAVFQTILNHLKM